MTETAPPPTSSIRGDLLTHAAHLRALARSLLGNDPHAEDVVQETYLVAMESPPGRGGNLRGWLGTVARNLVRQDRRGTQRREFRERRAHQRRQGADPADVAARVDEMRRVSALVLTLDEPYRTTVLLRFFDDLSPAEIARQLDLPPATVRTRLKRGLDQLRGRLDREHGGGGRAWRLALVPLAIDTAALRKGSFIAAPRTPLPVVRTAVLVLVGGAIGVLVALQGTTSSRRAPMPQPRWTLTPPTDQLPLLPLAPTDRAREPVRPAPASVAATPAGEARRRDTAPSASDRPAVPPPPPPPIEPYASDRRPEDRARAAGAPIAVAPVTPPGRRVTSAAEVPGLVWLPASPRQPIGMAPRDVRRFVEKEVDAAAAKRPGWEQVWSEHFLLMTPAHEVEVPAVHMGRHEVTNAQWKVFLDDGLQEQTVGAGIARAPADSDTRRAAPTLAGTAMRLYGTDPGIDSRRHQRAWLYLLAMNRETLWPLLGADAPGWDALQARAGDVELPLETRLRFHRRLPPASWIDGEPPQDGADRPVRGISWSAAMEFCHWAGLHVPTEQEWERAARGPEGRRFPWGDDWNPRAFVWSRHDGATDSAPQRPAPVLSLAAHATPDGLHHMAGNVAEWVLDLAEPYAGSATRFPLAGHARLARGGSFRDVAAVFLAADRAWDGMEGHPLNDTDEPGACGLRVAAYREPGRDFTVPLARLYHRPLATSGPSLWLPTPAALSAKERRDPERRRAYQGFDPAATAGVLERFVPEGETSGHLHVSARARGVAVLPVKGLPKRALRTLSDVTRLADDDDQVALIGVLTGATGMELQLLCGPRGERRWVGLDDDRFRADDGAPVGAFLVLRGPRVAVYRPDPGRTGAPDQHLRGEPLGYLPIGWRARRVKASAAGPRGRRGGEREPDRVSLRVPLPALDTGGRPVRASTVTHILLDLHVRGW